MDSLEMIARCAEVATRYHVFEAKGNEMCNTLGVVRKMVKDLGEVIECGCRQ